MALHLDPATGQRIQRQAELGPFHEPDEVVNRALDLLESQESRVPGAPHLAEMWERAPTARHITA